ncbi:hypothetical protein [Ancylobacter polymorphus]|uniref:Uncharacterized protein n=1 Tax=Ancylobacter polymorphus TaxID=223390 RepID=A0A9E7D8N8_9HYPH|nr:hypothetical protein [Ancylobacter polymorphus]UOK73971.1 hypothetical protein K9D25_24835 [Ancylobacter polymorphus]
MSWIKDIFLGKPDNDVIFAELPPNERRRKHDKLEFLKKRADDLDAAAKKFLEENKKSATKENFINFYYSIICASLYRERMGTDDPAVIDAIMLERFTERIPAKLDLTPQSWLSQLFIKLGTNIVVQTHFPSASDGTLLAALIEKRHKWLLACEADKPIIQKIQELRVQIAETDKAGMAAASRGERTYPYIIRIESCQNAIHNLKRQLNEPIESSWEENLRTG